MLFFNFNSVSDEIASSQVIVGEAVGDNVGDFVGNFVVGDIVSVGDDVGDNVHCPHDWTHINLALPRLLPSSSKIREPHLFCSTICSHVKILFFNFNCVSDEAVSSQTVGTDDVVGAGETVGDTVGGAVGDDVGAGEAVGEDVGSNVNLHPVHDLIQMDFAFPRLFPHHQRSRIRICFLQQFVHMSTFCFSTSILYLMKLHPRRNLWEMPLLMVQLWAIV